jgi:CRISPR-associated endonuclease/helicase Cas3
MFDKHYAHTREGQPRETWHPLEKHLRDTAEKASKHASAFGSGLWGELAGRWHDLGKYADDFQRYLMSFATDPEVLDASILDSKPGRVDHSSAGAIHVLDRCAGRLTGVDKDELPAAEAALAMVIAGHHSGLPERRNFEAGRLTDKRSRLDEARRSAPEELLGLDLPGLPALLRPESFTCRGGREEKQREKQLRHEFWTRMLFSALIDADRLDTERFMDEKKYATRVESTPTADILEVLRRRVDAHLKGVAREARKWTDDLPDSARERAEALLSLRADVLAACRQAAERPPGRHTLTVPTGGGKTLAALAFALEHAKKHGLRRVIVVIPFTSIIDQTAGVFREAFGADLAGALIEHHSNLDPLHETVGNRLASENWDAPIIVTTSVQFFESLFTSRGTAARKLHNIARSVVVFDEVQTLPHHLRAPIFDALNQLVDHYGVSALFCTATQPALELKEVNRQDFPHLELITEVVPDVPAAFEAVKGRVVADFSRADAPTTWEELAAELKGHDRMLVIVQRRDDARDLCRLLPSDTFHLSALMCAAHRRQELARITAAMDNRKTCRVISTTLVEAGVDLDFPVVYRALGGVDALAQAAGRCNREGRLLDAQGRPAPGRLIVFRSPKEPPPGLRLGADTTAALLEERGQLDLFNPETYQTYFRRYFADLDADANQVTVSRLARDFPEVDKRFRMIDDQGQVSVVVPFGDAAERIKAYRAVPDRRTLRALQPFIVNVPTREADFLASRLEVIHDQVLWLKPGPQYNPRFGLIVDEIVPLPPGKLVC